MEPPFSINDNQKFIEWLQRCLAGGDVSSAINELNKRIEKCPEDLLAYNVLAQLASKLEDKAILKNTFQIASKCPNPSLDLLCELANALVAMNDREAAKEAFEKALNIDSTHINSILGYARLLRSEGDFVRAFKKYGLVAQLCPTCAEAWSAIACMLLGSGDYSSGIAALKRARSCTAASLEDFYAAAQLAVLHLPNEAEGHICLSAALSSLRYYEDEQKSIQRALSLDPEASDAYYISSSLVEFLPSLSPVY